MKCCAIIPAYNEASQVAQVVQGLKSYLDQVIVVDDGSSDATARQAKEAGAQVLVHPKNRGKGAAIETGIQEILHSEAEAFFILDADAQHDWHEIPLFIKKMEETQCSIVIGNRMGNTANMPLIRKWTNQFTSWIISKLSGQIISDSQCGYRLIQKKVLQDVKLQFNRFDAESEILIQAARAGHLIAQVPIRTIYRGDEVSKINPIVDTLRFFKMAWKYRKRK